LAARPHRLALTVRSCAELVERLDNAGKGHAEAAQPIAGPTRRSPGPVLVFSGHGAQRLREGPTLLRQKPAFRAEVLRWDALRRPLAGESVIDALCAGGTVGAPERLDIQQPAVFVVQVALAALFRSWGVEPRAVVGHSLGEVAAAHVAGALDAAAAA